MLGIGCLDSAEAYIKWAMEFAKLMSTAKVINHKRRDAARSLYIAGRNFLDQHTISNKEENKDEPIG